MTKSLFLVLTCLLFSQAEAALSSVFWTVCTTDVYATGTGHIDADNYFTVFNKRGHGSYFAPDTGFELGILSWNDWSVEAGVDYVGGANDPLYFNIGAGIAEDKLFCNAPSFKIGFFNEGTHHHSIRTDQNIVNVIIGKSFDDWGRVCMGGFCGSRAMGKNRQGFMLSYQKSFCPAKHCDGTDYNKWVICADYASGKNAIGGGGVGLYYYFNPDISILTGPVWFNSAEINGKWKWTIQIDMSFSVFNPGNKSCS